ncbi:MAG: DUF763 domain-containing protein [Sulfobacillus thermotolerans]|uniref:DUF763 domain-containing protein n=1 Tax=Sulfobacillus thermotolerans TaxID=338644 RepID=A0ABN5H0M5_9FIRM|nr:hypothetical protein BXT84_08450 [Sulfobacillus thermotolerans]MCY0907631.1 DUF763 domain-containing protein [Sulfobacillus thermotolerans]
MPKMGTAMSPLHGGHCPPWLFQKMTRLSAAIIEAVAYEFGTAEALRRMADPVWFQAFGSVIGFDWHSSGLTTVGLGALKEGLAAKQHDLGLFVVGGKGKASRNTPQEIEQIGDALGLPTTIHPLTDVSRMVAKVDNALVQDGYQLYHHVMLFDKAGQWTVIQQGMNADNQTARRYHWLSQTVTAYTVEPHHGIVGRSLPYVLDLTDHHNQEIQGHCVELTQHPEEVLLALRELRREQGQAELVMPAHHDIPSASYLNKILYQIYDRAPHNYEDLLRIPGVGASTMRALAMVSEVVFGSPLTYHDPVRYSFAHGGKDGIPFPVDRQDYETSLAVLEQAISRAKVEDRTKMDSLRRLARLDILNTPES